jgi:entericidin B
MRSLVEEHGKMLRKVLIALLAGGIALTASACNTVRGVGNDLESAANSVDRAI